MPVSPGKHRIKIELPGYQTFGTEINLHARQKSSTETGNKDIPWGLFHQGRNRTGLNRTTTVEF
jgi:PEGA domain